MMVIQSSFLAVILFVFVMPIALAGFHKCVDAAGNITYTDQGCPHSSDSSAVKPLVAKPGSGSASFSHGNSRQLSSDSHTQMIQELIDSSRAECEAGLEAHVRSVHPDLRDEEIELGGVSDKYIRGGSVRISFLGHAKYKTERYHVDRNIECEASRHDAGAWQVEYFDKPYNLGIQFHSVDEL